MSLADFSSCEISDALIKLSVSHGGHIPDIRLVTHATRRICGPAYTVKFVLASDTDAPKLASHFVDTVTEGSVIIIDVPPGPVLVLILVCTPFSHASKARS